MMRLLATILVAMLGSTGCQFVLGIDEVSVRSDGGGPRDANDIVDAGTTAGISTSILVAPQDPTRESQSMFGFTATVGFVGFECRLDGSNFESCQSPYQTSVPEGDHLFEVRALDAQLLAGPIASYSWTVDQTGPNATVDPAVVTGSIATLTFALAPSESGASLECNINGGPFQVCTSPGAFTLGDGIFTFQVRGRDALGNVGSPASTSFNISTGAPPDTTIEDPRPPLFTNQVTPIFQFNSSIPGSPFECNIDGGAFAACDPGDSFGPLPEGPHIFRVRSIGPGGTDPSPATHSWTIDLTPPNTMITGFPSNPETSRAANFSFGSEANATFQCNLDGAGFAACSTPHNLSGPLATGSHEMRVRATDVAGNTDPTPAIHVWNIGIIAFLGEPTDGFITGVGIAPGLDGGLIPPDGDSRAAADDLCATAQQGQSALAGLEVRAFLCASAADSVSGMPDLFPVPTQAPIISLSKTAVSPNWASFAGEGALTNSLLDAGVATGSISEVWMGCQVNGQTSFTENCQDWTNGLDGIVGGVASTATTNANWLRSNTRNCNNKRPVLCVGY